MSPRVVPLVPATAIEAFLNPQEIDGLLSPWLADAAERAYVVRCILQAGPAHHRGANMVLLSLLGRVLAQLREKGIRLPEPASDETVGVPLRLPPQLTGTADDRFFPLRMSTRTLRSMAKDDERTLDAMVDCLIDGPPQHALANAAMVNLL